MKRGTLTSKDLGVVVLAGSTLGGGTVINWMTSFRTPPEILDEWARSSGISDLAGPGLQASFAAVEQRISVAPVAAHNRQNQLLYVFLSATLQGCLDFLPGLLLTAYSPAGRSDIECQVFAGIVWLRARTSFLKKKDVKEPLNYARP